MILSNKLRKWRPVRARQHWALLKRAREHGLSNEELSYLESPEDMIAGPADLLEAAIEWATEIEDKRRSRWLQTSPESGFVQNAVCQRFDRGELSMLRGKVLKIVSASGVAERTLLGLSEYRDVLERRFDIDVPDIERLWKKVDDRHAARLQEQQQQQ